MQAPRLLQVTTLSITLKSFLLPFGRWFRKKGWQVDAVAQGASSCVVCQETFDHVFDISWTRNPLDLRGIFHAVMQLRAVVKQEKYDLIHVHTPVAAFVTRYALRKMRKTYDFKVIYTVHGFHFHKGGSRYRNGLFLFLEKIAGRWVDYLIVINKEDYQSALHFNIVQRRKVCYMPGIGVDTEKFSCDSITALSVSAVRKELSLSYDEEFFLMVAEFNPGKCHRETIQALLRLDRPNVHLALAGTGPLLEQMKRLVRYLGVANQVHFLGFREDIPELMCSAVATILPSRREGLPRSLLESLSMGTPCIGTCIRGIEDILEEGAGLLVPVGDVFALSNAMSYILDNPEETKVMGRVGRKQAQTDYDIRNIIRLHEKLYRKALHGKDEI